MTITKNETKKLNKELKILCCAVYFFSYLSRQNYPAVLTEIIEDMNRIEENNRCGQP